MRDISKILASNRGFGGRAI